jgi:hypothetical protein
MIVYGCCVGDWDKFGAYVAPRTAGRLVIATSGHSGIVAPYNMIMGIAAGIADLDALVLVHDDLEITDPDAEAKFLAALAEPDVALVGVAGGGGQSIYWWEHAPIGHQQTDVRFIDFGTRAGTVTLIEGSIMVFAPWAVRQFAFDPIFTGFHGYDEIGKRITYAGPRVVVADVDTHHHNPEGYASAESAASCRKAAALYQEKWGLA